MRRVLIIGLIFGFIGLFLSCLGCNNPKPEVPASAYGKVVDQFPDVPEAKQRYKYPDNVELRHIPK